MIEPFQAFLQRCISVDLEVNPTSAKVFALAAVHADGEPAVVARQPPIEPTLDRLEQELAGLEHIVGHNILRHDLPHLTALRPRLVKMCKAPIDTLWLNPLAFPRNPYHHLVKHYHDGRLLAGHVSDPERDALLVFDVLHNQLKALRQQNIEQPDAVATFHYLTTRMENPAGFDAVFREVRQLPQPSHAVAREAISRLLKGRACIIGIDRVHEHFASPSMGWPTAYALSWILVAGGDSVMPPWVRMQFPESARIVKLLRDTACDQPDCTWCREQNDPIKALMRWFGFENFRPQPVDDMGRPLQERIVDEAMRGKSILGILPTGTGKSVCYQIPALSKFDRTGALTVVISPLVALMADQVQGMARAGISSAVTINGMLSMPERQDALDKVRLGDAAMLLISPEQLRSNTVRSVLKQREVGLWVLDEAHCVSKWGHDFRPDYRYIGRFMKESAGDEAPAPVLCLTATAKPEVVRDICEHFQARLGVELLLLDGGAVRTNLSFEVRQTNRGTKLTDILDVIETRLPPEGASGAIVYCATRSATERVATFLKQQGLSAERFHAGLPPDEKRSVQERFRTGELRIIAATNAFGMGIDKPDIRLVVHGDIPGSLENYLQEAGRAGRDRNHANCVLLFSSEDVERQFSLSARSRLARHEIGAILKALRRVDERTKKTGTVVATSGEIVRAELDREFERESATDDTRVKTAVSWLEEAVLLSREENRVEVFPSSLLVRTLDEAEAIIVNAPGISEERRKQLRSIVRHLMNAPLDQGISTDELTGASGLNAWAVNKALADLETLRIARNDVAATVFVHVGVEDSSRHRFALASRLEVDLIALMREGAPEAEIDTGLPLNLQVACQTLRDRGHASVRPDIVERLVRGMARDGRDQEGGRGNVRLRKVSNNTLAVVLQRTWQVLEQTANVRRQAVELLLAHLVGKVSKGTRGKDIQIETTLGDLLAILNGDSLLRANGIRDMTKLMERALLWMHEQEVASLGKGLTIFRQAMTVHLNPAGGQFTQKDFMPLEEHYAEQTAQTHVMAAYAERGLGAMNEAQRLSEDYFVLDRDAFLRRWLPGKGRELRRQTTGASWKAIVEALDNPVQQEIVADDREQTNVLVLAGPGSGKTRVLVHRIAYLIRVRREDPRDILVLTYNRHAAAEIRARLRHLVGDDAGAVTVSTCHALAMRLVGASFTGLHNNEHDFDGVLMEAVRQLNGEGLSRSEAEAQRETLIQGHRWILVDEYQDIGPEEYALISAVAGRSLEDPDLRLSLFAVGDDDQNIYGFAGASIDFIRRFEADYRAKPKYLLENYRSSGHIIAAANAVIGPAASRMKAGHDVTIDRKRAKERQGGEMATLDPVAQGRVQVLDCVRDDSIQAKVALDELVRLSRLDPDWSWARTAIIARDWRRLSLVRAQAEAMGIEVEMANETLPSIWRLREMAQFIALVRSEPTHLLNIHDLVEMKNTIATNRWTDLIAEGIAALARELNAKTMPVPDLVEWFAEWARDARTEQRSLLLLTAHRAKGLEFDDVVILDGGWDRPSEGEDADAPRRLFYVAMTRARRSLAILSNGQHRFLPRGNLHVLGRPAPPMAEGTRPPIARYQMPDLKVVDLSWAGRLGAGNHALTAIARAKAGDCLNLVQKDADWMLETPDGHPIGRMAKSWSPPPGLAFKRGEIGAIIRWRRSDGSEDYWTYMRRDEWEVVVPELVFG
ncbi:RecQ family ATP-dependent DNA helicase [Pelagibacterium flavum]|uniref:RecQ family ATP-dependent DNA helicase n=1 Tax=Pelagibacterium flavum TaxID=2984530 RepID=A0ABY6IKF3_9HYPH|nr:RecQ family ATP-dependent DNA helicase [Pelagibacterium sp. YIM 151497]UYQ70844.1 RecQ family ATP-dependent DNA helicase [Pelagibacterium sp. YIM 151497]